MEPRGTTGTAALKNLLGVAGFGGGSFVCGLRGDALDVVYGLLCDNITAHGVGGKHGFNLLDGNIRGGKLIIAFFNLLFGSFIPLLFGKCAQREGDLDLAYSTVTELAAEILGSRTGDFQIVVHRNPLLLHAVAEVVDHIVNGVFIHDFRDLIHDALGKLFQNCAFIYAVSIVLAGSQEVFAGVFLQFGKRVELGNVFCKFIIKFRKDLDLDFMDLGFEDCFLSGQIAALVNKEQPAAEIVKEVIEEAEPILRGALKWVK